MLSVFHERGLRVPEDLSLIGFDDDEYSAYLCPPLSTIAQPGGEVGAYIYEQIFNRLELKSEIRSRTYGASLLLRASA